MNMALIKAATAVRIVDVQCTEKKEGPQLTGGMISIPLVAVTHLVQQCLLLVVLCVVEAIAVEVLLFEAVESLVSSLEGQQMYHLLHAKQGSLRLMLPRDAFSLEDPRTITRS